MAKNPSFQFYATDFLVDTMRWKRDMKSLHVDLMCESWANGKLMDENGHPAGMEKEDVSIWVRIKHKWVLHPDGYWYNEKLEKSRREKAAFAERQRSNGARGGRPKKEVPDEFLEENKNPEETHGFSKNNPSLFFGFHKKKPLEDEEEDIYSLSKGVQGEPTFFPETKIPIVQKMLSVVKSTNASHVADPKADLHELREIAEKLADGELDYTNPELLDRVLREFETLYRFAMQDDHFRRYSLRTVNKHISAIKQSFTAQKATENATAQKTTRNNNQQSARDRQTAASAAVSGDLAATIERIRAGATPAHSA